MTLFAKGLLGAAGIMLVAGCGIHMSPRYGEATDRIFAIQTRRAAPVKPLTAEEAAQIQRDYLGSKEGAPSSSTRGLQLIPLQR